MLRRVGLDVEAGRRQRSVLRPRRHACMAANQREQELSSSWSCPIARPRSRPPSSRRNYHLDHFGADVRHQDGRRRGRAHARASASASSASPWRCSRRTASTRAWPRERARGARPCDAAGSSPLDPGDATARHPIHGEDRVWAETNCYVDLWIELLHALGLRPLAALPFTLAHRLRGRPVDVLQVSARRPVRALRPGRPGAGDLAAAGRARRGAGRARAGRCSSSSTRSTCPTPPGTAYQRAHVKTTVARERDRRRADGASATSTTPATTSCTGEDFDDVLRDAGPRDPACCRRTSSS